LKPSSSYVANMIRHILVFALVCLYATAAYPQECSPRTIVDLSTALQANGSMQLSWNPVPTAAGYKIYRSNKPNPGNASDWTLLARVTTPGYTAPTTSRHEFYRVTWYALPPNAADFALVEGGTFNNGVSDVTISTFYMSNHEVTQGEYQAVTGENPSAHPNNWGIGANFPVWYVSWVNAIAYCNSRSLQEGLTPCYGLSDYGTNPANWPAGWNCDATRVRYQFTCDWTADGYRLPTEMEWQFAARGGNLSHDYTFSGSNNIDQVGWYWGNWGYVFTAPHTVNGLEPNELGIYDMSGNLYEWVWDIPGAYPAYPQTDPHGPTQDFMDQRCYRGGAWSSQYPNPSCYVSNRNWLPAHDSDIMIGFRVCIAP